MNRENLCTIFEDLSTKMPARAGNSWCVFTVWLEPILSKTAERNQTKEASPATARQARHTTEKYSLLFSFCARRIFSSNEKSIFLWCPAFQVFRQVAGLAS